MNIFRLAVCSAWYFWRTNLAIAFGVATAVAVLVGALLVGESMRGSLRDITLDRLGRIDDVLTADHFFREELAHELLAPESLGKQFEIAVPAIMLPATTVEHLSGGRLRRSVDVTLFAVPDEVWQLQSGTGWKLADNQAVLNRQLADELGLASHIGDAGNRPRITMRLTSRQQLSSDSALGKKEGLVQSLPDVDVVGVMPDRELGRFGLRPTQMVPNNLFVSLSWLQKALGDDLFKGKADFRQANLVLLKRRQGIPTGAEFEESWQTNFRPTLDDLGLRLTRITRIYRINPMDQPVTAYEYENLSCDGLVFPDKAAQLIQKSLPTARPVFTYLANRLQVVRDGTTVDEAIPFSMVSGLSPNDILPLQSTHEEPITAIAEKTIVLNEWAASDLQAEIGDTIRLSYFEPEAPGGNEVERNVDLELSDVAKLTRPGEPYVRRGRQWRDAQFVERPTPANDPDFTPLVPGLTDADSIESWSLPFDTPGIRKVDDEYWKLYRTTPKGFVSLATAQSLWNSRFGKVTSYRMPVNMSAATKSKDISDLLVGHAKTFGFNLVLAREDGLRAAGGATPFDLLFLALSMFVMLSALILVTLMVRLAIQHRASQLGMLTAVGFGFPRLAGLWLSEMIVVCAAGALLGAGLGLGYAHLMLWGLRTWWVGAIRTPFIRLHASATSILVGAAIGLTIGLLTILWTLWRIRHVPSVRLLAGKLESTENISTPVTRVTRSLAWGLGVVALFLLISATGKGGETQAGLFFGSGFCTLAALLIGVRAWLRRPNQRPKPDLRIATLALLNARRNPLRSTLTIGLVAVASFLIVAISAFRIAPDDSGTGNFDFVATSNQPLFADLNSVEGRRTLLLEPNRFPTSTTVLSFRLKSGDDASCTNPFQVAQPRVIGVPESAIEHLASPTIAPFSWGGVESKFKASPWHLLNESMVAGEPIPAIIDKNTAWYSLKIYQLGKTFDVQYDTGERVTFRLAGLLNNTILQGSLLVGEKNFTRAFPTEVGYRYFLVRAPEVERQAVLSQLENDLADQGFDGRDSRELLAELLAVQNTYLSTFQALGALGLLLGTFGLAAVQLRSVLERSRELALLRAVGFHDGKIVRLVFLESFILLLAGLGVGVLAAAIAVFPHFVFGNASIPWLQLAIVFLLILTMGWLTVLWASRRVLKTPVLTALREP